MPAPDSNPAGADSGDAERCLHEVWAELTSRGFVIDEPSTDGGTCQCFYENLSGAYCEMDLLVTEALVWIYEPRRPNFSPRQTARLALALLTGISRPVPDMPPAPGPGLTPKDAVSRMLADCGMATEPTDIHYGPGEVSAEVMVTNPVSPHRGHVRISDETVQWKCCLATPGSPSWGLAPFDVAVAIAAALAGTAGGEAR